MSSVTVGPRPRRIANAGSGGILETIQHSPPSIRTTAHLLRPATNCAATFVTALALKMRRGERHLVWLKSRVVARK
jgi:hypothetical protein